MLPTLKPGRDVLVWRWFYQPKKGDIVAVKVNGKEIIKRISKTNDRYILIMGDNKKESTDSRNFGPISKEEIIGKVIWY